MSFLMTFAFTSCISDFFGTTGKGTIVSETRTATDFQSIELQTSATVNIIRDSAYKVSIEDYENILDNTSIKVVNHVLVISVTPVSAVIKNSAAKITIAMPDSLVSLVAAGSGTITVDSTFKDIKTLTATSSGNINLAKPINIKTLTVTVLGTGGVQATGVDSLLTCYGMGSGKIDMLHLVSEKVSCQNNGSGDILVNAGSTLKAIVVGSGNIYYLGSPTITKSIKGTGVVAPYTK